VKKAVWALPMIGSAAKIVAVTKERPRRSRRGETVLSMVEIPNEWCGRLR